ncbi:MAG: 50S ribosomal protein L30 [Deltaproteobacteria bacterium]|nr:50S ribosomal protein L30 [Deltaproteobacteria bacterium]
MGQIVVRQKRSLISEPESIRKVVKALGLGRVGKSVTHKDNNCIRGMVNKVKHLVSFELKA